MSDTKKGGKPYMEQRGEAWYLATPEQSDIAVGAQEDIAALLEKAVAVWNEVGYLDGTSDIEAQYALLFQGEEEYDYRTQDDPVAHIEQRTQDYMTVGLTEEQARIVATALEYGQGLPDNLSDEEKDYLCLKVSEFFGDVVLPDGSGFSVGTVESFRKLLCSRMTRYTSPYAVRDVDLDTVAGIIRGYIALWGTPIARDEYNTYFDQSRPPEMALDNGMHVRPITFEHNLNGVTRRIPIGNTSRVWFDQHGIAFEGQLDRSSEHFPMLVQAVQAGRLKTSSGTGEHTAEFYEDGAFRVWYLLELALTESPAETRMPAVTLVRNNDTEADRNEPRVIPVPEGTDAEPPQTVNPSAPSTEAVPNQQPTNGQRSIPTMSIQDQVKAMLEAGKTVEEITAFLTAQGMSQEEITALMAEVMPETQGNYQQEEQPDMQRSIAAWREAQLRKELDSVRSQVTQLQQQMQSAPPVQTPPVRRAPQQPAQPQITNMQDMRYDHLGASDAIFAAKLMSDRGIGMSDDFVRALSHKVVEAATANKLFRTQFDATNRVVRHARRLGVEGLSAGINNPYGTMRADEIMATDVSSGGLDWAGTYYSTTMWDFIRQETIVADLVSRGMMEEDIPAGNKTVVVPTVGADPTIYAANEANDTVDTALLTEATATPSKQTTGSVTVTANELRALVYRTLRLEEASVVNVATELNRSLQAAFADAYEYISINGDTETSGNTNINLIDGTPGSAPAKPKYLVTNGMLKSPLVTTTGYSRDNGTNALTDNDYLSTVALLPANLVATMTRYGVFIVDYRTYLATLKLASLKTTDVAGSAATLINGELRAVWGVPVLNSGQMGLANTAGKIAGTNPSTTNIYGRILFAVPRYWKAFWGRQVTIETDRDVRNSTTIIAAHMVAGIAKRSTDGAAVSYRVVV